MDSVFTAILVGATSTSADCVIGSYSLSNSNAGSMSSSGSYSLDTSAASNTAGVTVSVAVGSQTAVSPTFGEVVYDCRPDVSFQNF